MVKIGLLWEDIGGPAGVLWEVQRGNGFCRPLVATLNVYVRRGEDDEVVGGLYANHLTNFYRPLFHVVRRRLLAGYVGGILNAPYCGGFVKIFINRLRNVAGRVAPRSTKDASSRHVVFVRLRVYWQGGVEVFDASVFRQGGFVGCPVIGRRWRKEVARVVLWSRGAFANVMYFRVVRLITAGGLFVLFTVEDGDGPSVGGGFRVEPCFHRVVHSLRFRGVFRCDRRP